MDIEKEVQARVKFKMGELLTAIENTAKHNWVRAFNDGSQKHSHFYEAFTQFKGMLTKEMEMPTPYDNMSELEKKRKRNNVIDKIMERFCKHGDRDYQQKASFLVSLLEDLEK